MWGVISLISLKLMILPSQHLQLLSKYKYLLASYMELYSIIYSHGTLSYMQKIVHYSLSFI